MTEEIALPPSEPVDEIAPSPSVAPPETRASRGMEDAAAPPSTRHVWPFLGPTLCVFGVAMWAYAAMGELATSYISFVHGFLVGEGVAVLFVLAVTAATWWLAIRASLSHAPARSAARAVARTVGVAFCSFLLWGFVLFVTSAFGRSTHANLDGKITVFLLVAASVATFAGRRFTAMDLTERSPREKSVGRAAWVGAGLITVVVLLAIIAD